LAKSCQKVFNLENWLKKDQYSQTGRRRRTRKRRRRRRRRRRIFAVPRPGQGQLE
jgi:hypothetical protein